MKSCVKSTLPVRSRNCRLGHAECYFNNVDGAARSKSRKSFREQLRGSTSTLFFSTIVENGFVWIPALLRGKRWPDAHMLRPGELSEGLSDVTKKVGDDKAVKGLIAQATTLSRDELERVAVRRRPATLVIG